jgi:hypothetical protein
MGGAMACPRPGWPDHRACGAGRGQAIAPPIDGMRPQEKTLADFGREKSLSGGRTIAAMDPLPINRETTKGGRFSMLVVTFHNREMTKHVAYWWYSVVTGSTRAVIRSE